MRIIIDGDACPNIKEIALLAKENNMETIIFIDTNHLIACEYATIITVDYTSQNVDVHIINKIIKGDLVITNDYGLATICIGKGAKVISFNGFIYDSSNIDGLLELKHLKMNLRKNKIRIKNIKKRTTEDCQNLLLSINKIIGE
ncbi:MAG: DUF188 domain-containing protein [Bacilli bacterium]